MRWLCAGIGYTAHRAQNVALRLTISLVVPAVLFRLILGASHCNSPPLSPRREGAMERRREGAAAPGVGALLSRYRDNAGARGEWDLTGLLAAQPARQKGLRGAIPVSFFDGTAAPAASASPEGRQT